MTFKQFLDQNPNSIINSLGQNTVGTHNDYATGAYLPSTWIGSENQGRLSQSITNNVFVIPNTTKRTKIRSVEVNKNPIVVSLMDGTKLYLTIDQFNRVQSNKKLEAGEEISVTFQRRPEDTSDQPSKIISIN
jgi:hypothetical protein